MGLFKKRTGRIVFTAVCIICAGCGVPDISDQEIHKRSTGHIDIETFNADSYHFPDESWILYDRPSELGWSESKLAEAGKRTDSLETAALMVIHKGVLVYDWGATDEKYLTQSIRKGLLNSLYGIYFDRGVIDLHARLEELDINDDPPLTEQEQQATVEHLLQSTSGIYHSALYEVGSWKRDKPERGSHQPGEKWYYNNWDFNALGTIFEQQTTRKIGEAFEEEIANPLQMEDFRASDVTYITKNNWTEKWMGNRSNHPAYMFSVSARDLARYGLLFLNRGQWEENRIFSEEWIDKSWEPVDIDRYYTLKFGYLWWLFEDGIIFINGGTGFEDTIYFTSGNRGHKLFVIPYLDLVVVHRVYAKGVDFWSQMKRGMLGINADVNSNDVYLLLEMIREAHPDYQ